MQDSWSKQESLPAIKRRVNDAQKIFHSIITVAMVVLFASLFISSTFLYDYFNQSQASQLKEELSLVASNMDEEGVEYFDHFDSSMFRFTLVSADVRFSMTRRQPPQRWKSSWAWRNCRSFWKWTRQQPDTPTAKARWSVRKRAVECCENSLSKKGKKRFKIIWRIAIKKNDTAKDCTISQNQHSV